MNSTHYLAFFVVFAAVFCGIWALQNFWNDVSQAEKRLDDSSFRLFSPRNTFIFVLSIAGGLLPAILLFMKGQWQVSVGLVVATFACWTTPFFLLSFERKKMFRRKQYLDEKMLDITIGLAGCLRTGMGLSQAFSSIVDELDGPVGDEFEQVRHEHQNLHLPLSEALKNLHQRLPSEDVALLAVAIQMTGKAGGSLGQIMDNLTGMIRARRDLDRKLHAMTAQGRCEAIAVAVMPLVALLVFACTDFELIRPLFTTPIGWTALGVAFVLECIAYVVIKQILRVEV
jgi:Flp pilus assembly protein TadB